MSKYVMIRNFSILNNVVTDTDIIFIDKASYREIIEDLKRQDTSDVQVFPVEGAKMTGYSNNYKDFNNNIFKEYLINGFDTETYDEKNQYVYYLYENIDGVFKEKNVKNNTLRLYHPVTKTSLNGIICIKNIINDINIYYLCKRYDQYVTHSETEIIVDNNKYSEYIEIDFPNIEDLFGINKKVVDGETVNDYSTYYIESMNIMSHDTFDKESNVELIRDIIKADHQYIPLNLIIQPFKIREAYIDNDDNIYFDVDRLTNIEELEKVYIKDYVNIERTIENNYITFPFTFIIFPYDSKNEDSGTYNLDVNFNVSNIQISTESKIYLTSRLGFSNGRIALLNKFIYPNKEIFTDIKDAYLHLNNIKIEDYDDFYGESLDDRIGAISYHDISEIELDVVKNLLNQEKTEITKSTILAKYKELLKEQILEDYDNDITSNPKFIGFKIEVATDNNFSSLIYEKEIECKLDELSDFNFEIDGIVEDWTTRPDKLLARTLFVDKYLGTIIESNFVVITKEWFKYIVNNDYNIATIQTLEDANKEYNVMLTGDQKEVVLNKDNVNFINTIKCIVSKKIDTTNGVRTANSPKVIFKPVFYKVQNLQNIQIRQSVKQNVGVNLSEYMTKVSIFKLLINNQEIVESARNDMYVIFSIDGKKISEYSGKYDIVNQDDEYISSGNYVLI